MADKRISVTIDSSGAKKGIDDIMSGFDRMNRGVNADMRKMTRGVMSGFREMASAAKRYTIKMVNSFKSVVRILTSMRSLISAAFFAMFLRSTIKATVLFEKFASTLTVVTGDFGKAREQVKNLIDISNELGISFEDALSPFAKFFAAARGTLGDNEIIKVFTAFGEAAVALQLNGQEIQGVFLALQQIASKGRVSMEELRLQLAERIPGAMQLAADAMGTTIRKLEDDIRKGTISSGDFLTRFADKVHSEYAAAAEVASRTTIASINRFKNAWLTFLNDIGEGGLAQGFKDSLASITEWLSSNGELANKIGEVIGNMMRSSTEFFTQLSGDDIRSTIETMVNGFIALQGILEDIANSSFFKWVFANEEESRLITEVARLQELVDNADDLIDRSISKDQVDTASKWVDEFERLNRELETAKLALDDIRKPFTFSEMGAVNIGGAPTGIGRPGSGRFVGPLPKEAPTVAQIGTFNQAREDANRSIDTLAGTKDVAGQLKQVNAELANAKVLLTQSKDIMNDQEAIMSSRIANAQSIVGITDTISKLRKKQLTLESKITSEKNRQREAEQQSARLLLDVDLALKSHEARHGNILMRARSTKQEVNRLAGELKKMREDAANAGPVIPDQMQEDIKTKLKVYKAAVSDAKSAMSDLKDFTDDVGRSFGVAFEDAIIEGEKLGEVIRSLTKDIARLVIQQTFTKPLAAGISSGLSGMFTAASGGVMTSQGPMPLKTYSSGGVATSPQFAVFGEGSMNEAYVPLPDGKRIPVHMKSSRSGKITVNVSVTGGSGEKPNVQTNQRQNANGDLQLDVMIEQIEGSMAANINRGRGLAPMLETQYGLNRAPGAG